MHYDKWIAPTDPKPNQLERKNAELAYEIGIEGMVLLSNDGTLPLKNKKIALYGVGARHSTKGGTGSGEVHNRYNIMVEEGLKQAGFTVLSERWLDKLDEAIKEEEKNRIKAMKKALKPFHLWEWGKMLPASDAVPPVFPTSLPINEILNTDTAVYVVTRQAGEGRDRRAEKGDYYLTDLEEANIAYLAATYPHFVLIINAGGPVDLSILDQVQVNSVVFMGQPGQEGGRILSDLLSGKQNFSGHLTLSWPKKLSDLPSGQTYSHLKGITDYENYREGLYVGYRFHDTFNVAPRYHFGFGLSYTEFTLACGLRKNGKEWYLDYEVRNVGRSAGKAVIQVYAAPFTSVEAEAKKLIAFQKSGLLVPQQEEKGSIQIDIRRLAYYDEVKAAFIIAAGNYVIKAWFDSIAPKNVAVIEVKESIVVERCVNVCPKKDPFEEVKPPRRDASSLEGLPTFDLLCSDLTPIVHDYRLPPCPPFSFLTDDDLADLVSGSLDPLGNEKPFAIPQYGGRTDAKYFTKLGVDCLSTADGPAGLRLGQKFAANDGKKAKAPPIPENLCLGKPIFRIINKILGFSFMKKHYQYATSFPTGLLQASTWNVGLMERMGRAIGAEMEEYDIDLWLAPGMNIVRNPLCGRSYEYYSEDPYLSGMLAGHLSLGVNALPGRGLTLKHYCCNSQEDDRFHCDSRLSERVLREIYLSGFKLAISIGHPACVMSSYNKVNGVYAGSNSDLGEKVLRNEFGFDGFVMSDWDAEAPDRASCEGQLKGGTDLLMPGNDWTRLATLEALRERRLTRADLEKAVNRIINVANRLKEGKR